MVYEDERPFDYPGSSQGSLYGDRDGDTFEPEIDLVRLNKQMVRVWYVIRNGAWWTLREISDHCGDPEASVSARLRDLRKPRFGGHKVHRRRSDGTFEYRLEWSTYVEPPTMAEIDAAFGWGE